MWRGLVKPGAQLAALCVGGAYTMSLYEESLSPSQGDATVAKKDNAFRLKRRLPTVWRPADCLMQKHKLADNRASFSSVYELGKKLGVGAYAVVYECVNKETGNRGAVKVFDRSKLSRTSELEIKQEVDIMRSLSHPAIVRVFDWYDDEQRIFIVMELCKGGELFDRIVEKQHYSEKEARDVLRTVLQALAYCHENSIVHRDLKPENLLLESPEDSARIKIADFGIAGRVKGPQSLSRNCGTPGYTAPEIIQGAGYDEKVDLWSVGVIAFILLGGYQPFDEDEERVKQGLWEFHSPYWDHVSEEAKDLIRRLLVVDPKDRLTAKDALQHHWVQARDEKLAQRDLTSTKQQIAKYNAKRKFKAAVDAVVIANRMKHLTEALRAKNGGENGGKRQ